MRHLIGLLFVPCVLCAADGAREVVSEAVTAALQPLPVLQNGYLYFLDNPSTNYLRAYAPDGHLALTTSLPGTDGGAQSIQGVAFDDDGTTAFAWSSSGNNPAAGIRIRDAAGRWTTSIDTGRFVPVHLAFSPDHDVWAFGWQRKVGTYDHRDTQDYMTVRRFSPDGKQAGAWLRRSSFPKGLEPACDPWQTNTLTVTASRVGILACSGEHGSMHEWIELGADGQLIGRLRLDDSNFSNAVLTSTDRVVAQTGSGPSNILLYELDHKKNAWRAIPSPATGQFMGIDHDQLVFRSWYLGPVRLQYFPMPELTGN